MCAKSENLAEFPRKGSTKKDYNVKESKEIIKKNTDFKGNFGKKFE